MKKSIIILLSFLILIISVLCLKISLVEYFDNSSKEFNKIIKKLEKQFNTKEIKTKCKREYNNCLKSPDARKKLIKMFNEKDFVGLNLLTSNKEIVELRDCAIENLDLLSII